MACFGTTDWCAIELVDVVECFEVRDPAPFVAVVTRGRVDGIAFGCIDG